MQHLFKSVTTKTIDDQFNENRCQIKGCTAKVASDINKHVRSHFKEMPCLAEKCDIKMKWNPLSVHVRRDHKDFGTGICEKCKTQMS